MKNTHYFQKILAAAVLVGAFSVTAVYADPQADKDAYQRKISKEVQELEMKIDQTRDEYKKDGIDVNQEVQQYQDRISEIKRQANQKLQSSDWDSNENAVEGSLTKIRHDFYEWRLRRTIAGYKNKIDDLKAKALNETDSTRKADLDAKIKSLEAKNDAIQTRYNILAITQGDDWDKVQKELDDSVNDIEKDYRDYREANHM